MEHTVDLVIVDVTQIEISMITRIILVWFNNDATACFDNIMPPYSVYAYNLIKCHLNSQYYLVAFYNMRNMPSKQQTVSPRKLTVTQKTPQYMDPDRAVQLQLPGGANQFQWH